MKAAGGWTFDAGQPSIAVREGHLWSQDYERSLSAGNIFRLQAELAGEIAEKLGVRLTAAEEARIRGGGTESLRALDLYDEALTLRPAAAAHRIASERIDTLLGEAIQLDSLLSLGWAAKGDALSQMGQWEESRDACPTHPPRGGVLRPCDPGGGARASDPPSPR